MSSERTETDTDPAAGPRRWLGLAAIALAQLMIVVDMTIINVALPSIGRDLGIGAAGRQWVVTAYTLPFAGLLLLGGRVADRTGRKPALLIGLAGFAAASAAGGMAASTAALLTARAAQGVFGALLAPASLSLLATTFAGHRERARAFGVFAGVTAAGSPVGLVLGGVLTTALSWHWVLYINVPVAVITGVLAAAFLSSSPAASGGGYDIRGVALATGGLAALVYGLAQAASDWASPRALGSFAAGAVALGGFVIIESRARDPLLPPPVWRSRARGGAYLVVLLMMAAPFGVYLFTSYYLQDVRGYTALLTGVSFLPMTFGVIAGTGVGAQLTARLPQRFVIAAGLLLGVAGMALLARLGPHSSYAAGLLPSFAMTGLGMGVVLPPALELSTSGVQPHHAGIASAMFNVAQQTGSSLDTALLGTVAAAAAADYAAAHPHAPVLAQMNGYHAASACAATLLALAAVAALALINTPRPGSQAPDAAPDRATALEP
jgi:EmrB/QacA subfamily drug resistance transporter